MKYKVMLTVFVGIFFCCVNAQAGNPGKAASHCIEISKNAGNSNNVIFKNTCGYKIFVTWCGDLAYSNKNCGDGKKTHILYPFSKY